MHPLWFHGGEAPVGVGEVGSLMYDNLPAHVPALVLGAGFLLVCLGRSIWGAWRQRSLRDRFLLGLILFEAGAHLGLAITAEGTGWRLAFLSSSLFALWIARRLLTGRPWRLWASAMWIGSLVGYWISSLGGHPVDQIGLVVKFAEIVGLFLTLGTRELKPGKRRILPGFALLSAVLINTIFVWASAFRAGSGDLGVVSHHAGTSPTPGMVMAYTSPHPPSSAEVAFGDWLFTETRAAIAPYSDPAVAAAAGYQMSGLSGNDFHAANPAYQKDGRELDPAKPENLVYAMGPQGPVLMGAMFETEGLRNAPPASGGHELHWHRHEQVCFSIVPLGLTGLVDPAGLCPIGSLAMPTTNSMMHVWVVPGAPQRFGDLDEDWKAAYLAGPDD